MYSIIDDDVRMLTLAYGRLGVPLTFIRSFTLTLALGGWFGEKWGWKGSINQVAIKRFDARGETGRQQAHSFSQLLGDVEMAPFHRG